MAYPNDLRKKIRKALDTEGPCFLHVFAPCPTGWGYASERTVEIAKLAVQTGVFVLWELAGSDFNDIKVTKKPKDRKPVIEYLKVQRRFKHLMDKPHEIERIQAEVDEKCTKYGF
jgi:pyruvate ferredoxin oxidoreductase beta subunit